MEQSNAEFSCNWLVIWARKQRLIHLDAGVGNKNAASEDYIAAAQEERQAGG
jgi:hypothetical protein